MIYIDVRHDLRKLAAALAAEEDGKQLKRELVRNFKAALEPAVREAKSNVTGMASHGHAGPPLRRDVARHTALQVKLGKRTVGVKMRATGTKVRGFTNAPRLLNKKSGWRHPSIEARGRYWRRVWVRQISSRPLWFDDPIQHRRTEFRRAAIQTMQDMAQRIARRH